MLFPSQVFRSYFYVLSKKGGTSTSTRMIPTSRFCSRRAGTVGTWSKNGQPAIPNALVRVIQRMQPKTSEGPGTSLADANDAKLNTS